MNRIILMIAAWMMAVGAAVAQEATVKRVEMTPTDLSASKYARFDNNGEACALVRVEVIADDVEFFGNVIQPVEHKTGDYWVYMLGGSKMLQIKSRSFLPLFINFADYGINALQPRVTYVITLSLPATSAQQQSATSGRNYLLMNVSPANAKVTVDGAEREVRDGKVKTLLRHGTYSYHVEAPGYLPEDGQVTVGSDRAELTVTLRSTKGTLAVSTTTPGTEGQLTDLTDSLEKPSYQELKYKVFKNKGKYGFKDENGKVVIPARFDNAFQFSEGLAAVEVNGKWGFIDKNALFIIPAIYDFVQSFNNGKAYVGYLLYRTRHRAAYKKFDIDRNGNEVK